MYGETKRDLVEIIKKLCEMKQVQLIEGKICRDHVHMYVAIPHITENDLENEIDIFAIAINISELTQSLNGFVYPEISFFGNCECEPEHGICIGFRDKKFLGIQYQDWTL